MPSWLQLTRNLARDSGTVDPNTITTASGATGRIARLADTVADAWVQIQNNQTTWRFLTVDLPSTTTLTEGVSEYTAANLNLSADNGTPDWSNWIMGDAAGEVPLSVWPKSPEVRGSELPLAIVPYRGFRQSYQTGATAASPQSAQPRTAAVDTQDRLVVYPVPDQDYLMAGTYRRTPQMFTADDDEPIIAEEFHPLITACAKLLLDHRDEAGGDVLLADINLPMALNDRMAALRRRYLGQGVALAFSPVGGRSPGGGNIFDLGVFSRDALDFGRGR